MAFLVDRNIRSHFRSHQATERTNEGRFKTLIIHVVTPQCMQKKDFV